MLGSMSEADDAVQEAWLRLSRADTAGIENLSGWLTTVVARVCLNILRARRSRREEPLDVHVPDPLVSAADRLDPEQAVLLADSVGLALLVVLDTLAPDERLAFVLHDMFAVPFGEIAPSWGAPRRRHGSSRVGHADACSDRRPFPTRISTANEKWSTPFSLPRATATLTPFLSDATP
jgi:DNA-directed RNA polymerase specialized sigma24 family protein